MKTSSVVTRPVLKLICNSPCVPESQLPIPSVAWLVRAGLVPRVGRE